MIAVESERGTRGRIGLVEEPPNKAVANETAAETAGGKGCPGCLLSHSVKSDQVLARAPAQGKQPVLRGRTDKNKWICGVSIPVPPRC